MYDQRPFPDHILNQKKPINCVLVCVPGLVFWCHSKQHWNDCQIHILTSIRLWVISSPAEKHWPPKVVAVEGNGNQQLNSLSGSSILSWPSSVQNVVQAWFITDQHKMRSQLAAQFMPFFRPIARILTFCDKEYRILTFRDKKYRILTFRDKKCPILTKQSRIQLFCNKTC